MKQIRVIDSHTGGEPTRLVIEGGPDSVTDRSPERAQIFREQFDPYRSAIVNEPRGSDTIVGALLCAPHRADCSLGVIFFNNVGYLGMCGHGTIGLVASLAHAGRLGPGRLRIDTPVRPGRRRAASTTGGSTSPMCLATARRKGSSSRWRASGRCAAMSPGAATGSSWSKRRADESRARTMSRRSPISPGVCARH